MALTTVVPQFVIQADLVSRIPQCFPTSTGSSTKNLSSSRSSDFLGSAILLTRGRPRSIVRLASSPSAKWWSLFSTAKASNPQTLTFFVHERRAPPDVSLLSIAAPGGQLGLNKLQFGSLCLYDNIIRDAVAEDAQEIGKEAGLVGLTSDNTSFYMSHVYSLSTPTYSGSLTLQGRFNPSTTSELAITGGTGDFRFVRGYATANTVFVASDQSLVVFKYDLTLKYDD